MNWYLVPTEEVIPKYTPKIIVYLCKTSKENPIYVKHDGNFISHFLFGLFKSD